MSKSIKFIREFKARRFLKRKSYKITWSFFVEHGELYVNSTLLWSLFARGSETCVVNMSTEEVEKILSNEDEFLVKSCKTKFNEIYLVIKLELKRLKSPNKTKGRSGKFVEK